MQFLVVLNGVIEFVNFSGLKLFETINIESLIEKSFFQFVQERHHAALQQEIDDLISGKTNKIEFSPAKIKSLNNKLYTVDIVGSLIEFKGQSAVQLIINDRTKYFESQRIVSDQNDIINNMHDGVVTMSLNGLVTSWSNGAENIFKCSKDDITGHSFTSLFPESDESELQESIINNTIQKQNSEIELEYHDNKTDNPQYLQLSLSVLTNSSNETTGIVCYVKDITERKKENEALKTSEINLKSIFDGSTEAIFFVDQEHKIIDSNRLAKEYATKLFNNEISEGKHIFKVLSFLNKNEFSNMFDNSLDGVSHNLERSIIINEKKYHFKITIYPILSSKDEDINRYCVSFLDITEKKKTERELAETHAELKPLFDNSIQRFYLTDLNYKLLAFNKTAKEIIKKEYKRNLAKGDSLLDFVPKEVGFDNFKEHFETAKEGKNVVFKVKITFEHNSYWAEAHLDPIKDETGETKRILFWTLDVTEREEHIAALRESEERYALIASGSNDGLWDWDMQSNELYLSPRWKSVVGYEMDEIITRKDMKDKIIHPEDLKSVKAKLNKYLKGLTKTYVNEYRVRGSDGEYKWILERGVALRDESGKPYRLAGSITNINDSKRAEEELLLTNKMLLQERSMFIKGNVVIFRVDASEFTNVTFVSENVDVMLGYNANDFKSGKVDFTSLIHPDDYEMHENERKKAIESGLDHIDYSNYRLIRKDGNEIWVKDATSLLKNEEGEVVELLGYSVDITLEKKAEKALMENQRKYFSLFSKASDAIIVIDNDIILDCNSMALELFGYSEEELKGLNISQLAPKEHPDGDNANQRKISEIEEHTNETFNKVYEKKDGSLFDAEVSIAVVQIDEKKFHHAIIRDITERIKTEKALRDSENKNKALLQAIPDLLFVIDRNGDYLDFKASEKTGMAVAENKIVGKNFTAFFSGDKLQEVMEKTALALDTKEVHTVEYELSSPKGKRWFESRITPFKQDMVLWLVRDVTDRVNMEMEIRQNNLDLEEKLADLKKNVSEN